MPINENDSAVVNPIKRLAWGSIIAGFLIAYNITPFKTSVITMALPLKLAALVVSVIGLLMAVEMAFLTTQQVTVTPKLAPHRFSNMLGFFPVVVHRVFSKFFLTGGYIIASQTIDLA